MRTTWVWRERTSRLGIGVAVTLAILFTVAATVAFLGYRASTPEISCPEVRGAEVVSRSAPFAEGPRCTYDNEGIRDPTDVDRRILAMDLATLVWLVSVAAAWAGVVLLLRRNERYAAASAAP